MSGWLQEIRLLEFDLKKSSFFLNLRDMYKRVFLFLFFLFLRKDLKTY